MPIAKQHPLAFVLLIAAMAGVSSLSGPDAAHAADGPTSAPATAPTDKQAAKDGPSRQDNPDGTGPLEIEMETISSSTILLPASTTMPADGDAAASILQQRVMLQKHLEETTGKLPTKEPITLAKLIQLSIQQQHLMIATTQKPDAIEYRVNLTEPVAQATFSYRELPAGGVGKLQIVQVQWYDFSDPSLVTTHYQLMSINGQTQLNMEFQGADSLLSIQLIDRYAAAAAMSSGGGSSISLYVNSSGENTPDSVRIRLAADNLQSLYYQQTRLVNAYVRPMLRQLGSESLLEIKPSIAWQVVGDQRDVSPAIRQRVMDLLKQLDADAYQDRDAAQNQLQEIGSPAVRVLKSLDPASLSPEQASRVEQVITQEQSLNSSELQLLSGNVDFLVDCLLIKDEQLRKAVLSRLNEGRKEPISLEFPEDPKLLNEKIDALRKQILPPPPIMLDTTGSQSPHDIIDP